MGIFSKKYPSLLEFDYMLDLNANEQALRARYSQYLGMKFSEVSSDYLNYCSGAANFVVAYFTRSPEGPKALFGIGVPQVAYNSSTIDTILPKILSLKGPYIIGFDFNAGGGLQGSSHVLTIVHDGSVWGMYQANKTGDENARHAKDFGLSQRVNALYGKPREWNKRQMSKFEFVETMQNIVSSKNKMFIDDHPLFSWNIAVINFDRRLLIPAK